MNYKDFIDAVSKTPPKTFIGVLSNLIEKTTSLCKYVPNANSVATLSSDTTNIKNAFTCSALLSLGVSYSDKSKMLEASQALQTSVGTPLNTDFTTGTVVYQAASNKYLLKTHIGDDTWAAARSWVAQEYDPGDVSVSVQQDIDFSAWVPNAINDFILSDDAGWPLVFISASGDYIQYTYLDGHLTQSFLLQGQSNTYTYVFPTRLYAVLSNGTLSVHVLYVSGVSNQHNALTMAGLTMIKSGTNVVVGTAAPDIVDNPTADFVNGKTGQREVAIPLDVLPSGSTATPDVSIDGHPFIVSPSFFDNILNANPLDVPNLDISGLNITI